MHSVGKKNHEQVQLRINPHRRASEPAVAERTLTQKLATIAGVLAAHVPSEPAPGDLQRRADRVISVTVRELSICRSPALPRESIMSAYSAMSSAVENRPACPATPLSKAARGSCTTPAQPLAIALFGRGGASAQRFAGEIARVGHAKRAKNVLSRKLRHILTRHPPHNFAQDQEADVRVNELLADRALQLQVPNPSPGFVDAVLIVAQRIVGNQTASMREQVFNRDLAFAVGANSGTYSTTGARNRTCPRSTNSMMLVAVATGLVSDAMSNTVSRVIFSGEGSSRRCP